MAEVELRKPTHVSQPPKKVYMNWMRQLQQQRGQTTTSGSATGSASSSASGSATGSASGSESESGSVSGSASVEPSPAPNNDTAFTKPPFTQWDHTTTDDKNITSAIHNPGQIALGLTSLCVPCCLPIPSQVHIGNDHIGVDYDEHYVSCPGSQKCPSTESSSSPLMQHRPVAESYQASVSKSENAAATRCRNESRQTVLVDSRVSDLSKNKQVAVVSESSDPSSNGDAPSALKWLGIVGSEVIEPTALHPETNHPLPIVHYRKAEPSACYEKMKPRQTFAVGGVEFVRSMAFVFGRDGENECRLQSTVSVSPASEKQGVEDRLPMQAFHRHLSNTHLVYKENGDANNIQRCSSPNVHCSTDSSVCHVSGSSILPLPYSSTLPDFQMIIDRSKSSSDLLHMPASLEQRNVSQDVSKRFKPLSSIMVSRSSTGDAVCHRSAEPECPSEVGEYSNGAVHSSTTTQPDQPTTPETDSSSSEICQVCSDTAAGFHCGAFVCEACKKFFVRYLKQNAADKFMCPRQKCCEMMKETRTQCQYCRYQKCLGVGMYKPGGTTVSSQIGHIPCKVCGAPSSGYHFGAITCEGCKGFFRRTVKERDSLKYQCNNSGNCQITTHTRNDCKFCRYKKCLGVRMTLAGSRIGRQSNSVKHATLIELRLIKSSQKASPEHEPIASPVTSTVASPSSLSSTCSSQSNEPSLQSVLHLTPEPPQHEDNNMMTTDTLSSDDDRKGDESMDAAPCEVDQREEDGRTLEELLVDVDWVIGVIESAAEDLNVIRLKNPHKRNTTLAPMTPQEVWAVVMEQFQFHVHSVLKFTKKVPGVRQLPIASQIMMVQQSLYSIVLMTYSLEYDIEHLDYNYFSMSHEEEAYVQSFFPPHRMLIDTFHLLGHVVQLLKVDETESAFLCGLCLLSQSDDLDDAWVVCRSRSKRRSFDSTNSLQTTEVYQEALVSALTVYCERKASSGPERVGLLLLRLCEMLRCNQIHFKSFISIETNSSEYHNVKLPQLFRETFLNI